MIDEIKIRNASFADIAEMRSLFKNTVNTINCSDYTEQEIKVWIKKGSEENRLKTLLSEHNFYLAILKNNIVGYSSLNAKGYIHSLYIDSNFQRKGIAKLLIDHIFKLASHLKLKKLSSDVSITALPFFEKYGFTRVKRNENKIESETLINYHVEKLL